MLSGYLEEEQFHSNPAVKLMISFYKNWWWKTIVSSIRHYDLIRVYMSPTE